MAMVMPGKVSSEGSQAQGETLVGGHEAGPDVTRRVTRYERRKRLAARSGSRGVDGGDSSGLLDPVFCEVVTQRPLADPHRLRGVFFHAAGTLERAPNGLAFRPLDVLPQVE